MAKTAAAAEMKYEIMIGEAAEGSPDQGDVFVGPNGRTVLIKRGVRVVIDAATKECLDNAVQTVAMQDPAHPEDPTRKILAERQRFPYSLLREIAPA